MWVAWAVTLNQGDELQSFYTIDKYRIYSKNMIKLKTKILWVARTEVFIQEYNIEIINNEIERLKEIKSE